MALRAATAPFSSPPQRLELLRIVQVNRPSNVFVEYAAPDSALLSIPSPGTCVQVVRHSAAERR